MENNPLAMQVLEIIDHLVDDLDAVQVLLDAARADTDDNNSLLAIEVRRLHALRLFGAGILTRIDIPAEQRQATLAALAEAEAHVEAAVVLLREHRRQLFEIVCLLRGTRIIVLARRTARRAPGVLFRAAAITAVVYAVTGGVRARGFMSFVRVSGLALCFLFGAI